MVQNMQKLFVLLCLVPVFVGAQDFQLPNIPFLANFPQLPTAEQFMEIIFNVTDSEIDEIVDSFGFDEYLPNNVDFLLYKDDTFKHVFSNTSIDTSDFTKFIIHGWQSAGNASWIRDIARTYNAIGIKNVISVDWTYYAKRNYIAAARATKKVGEILAQFIMDLLKNDTSKLKHVHIIGHSLGAQVAGFAGKQVKNLTNGIPVSRITGLDAAAPLFEFPLRLPTYLRISQEDAAFVDSIHTNAGFMGFLSPFAKHDYYVDFGGPIQPGCLQSPNIFDSFACSHGRSIEIFNSTIKSKNYLATSCDGPLLALTNQCDGNIKVVMGEHANGTELSGGFYIMTTDNNGLADTRSNKVTY